jgi:hypothetical protein
MRWERWGERGGVSRGASEAGSPHERSDMRGQRVPDVVHPGYALNSLIFQMSWIGLRHA